MEPILLEYDAGGVHPSEDHPIDGYGYLRELDRSVSFTHNSARFNLLNSALYHHLTAGSGLVFEDAGEHELKGVPDRWHLYRVVE